MTITTAEPVSRKSRKIVRARLGKVLDRPRRRSADQGAPVQEQAAPGQAPEALQGEGVIREIDLRGNPRISSRVFILRAR